MGPTSRAFLQNTDPLGGTSPYTLPYIWKSPGLYHNFFFLLLFRNVKQYIFFFCETHPNYIKWWGAHVWDVSLKHEPQFAHRPFFLKMLLKISRGFVPWRSAFNYISCTTHDYITNPKWQNQTITTLSSSSFTNNDIPVNKMTNRRAQCLSKLTSMSNHYRW